MTILGWIRCLKWEILVGFCIGILAGAFLTTHAMVAISAVCTVAVLVMFVAPMSNFVVFVAEYLVQAVIGNLIMWATYFIMTMPTAWKELVSSFVFTQVLR